jgi:hypothetical protein
MEAMLIAGLAAFALGWLLRRVQEPASGTSRTKRTAIPAQARRRTRT